MKKYEDYITKYSDNFKRVLISDEYANKIHNFVKKLIDRKKRESHHKIDCQKEEKRFLTGLLGEAALEKLLNLSIIDWSIGDSNDYHHPDIPGYKLGIKTVEQGKFPIIFKKNYYPQVICILSSKIKNLVFVCGIATVDVLNEYQDDNLILDKNLRARGTKTGFFGFDKLIKVTQLSDIDDFKN